MLTCSLFCKLFQAYLYGDEIQECYASLDVTYVVVESEFEYL